MEPAARRRPGVEEVGGSQELLWFENYQNWLDTHWFGDYNDVDDQVSLKEPYSARANKVTSLKEGGATSATNSMAGAEGLRRGEGASAADTRKHATKVLSKRGGGGQRRRGPSAQ